MRGAEESGIHLAYRLLLARPSMTGRLLTGWGKGALHGRMWVVVATSYSDRSVCCMFDNTAASAALGDALKLTKLLEETCAD
jgi:hypothetical protein